MEARASPLPRRGSSKDLPFYEVPDDKLTPAKIVSEAKHIIGLQPGLRTLTTRRPETPRDDQRNLFGEQSVRDPTNRPPSAFSLGSRHFDSESRPVSGTRLTPLEHKPKLNELESALAPKPPTDPNRRRPGSRAKNLSHSTSVDASQDGIPPKSASCHDSWNNVAGAQERRSGSGGSTRDRRHAEHDNDSRRSVAESGYSSDHTRVGSAGSYKEGETQSSSRGGSASSQGTGSAGRNRSAGSERVTSAGKPGSGGRREEETSDEAHFYNTRIGPIIDEMATHIKDKDPDKLLALSEELYSVLDRADLLGKNCKRRSLILKTVFKLLDLVSPRLLLKLARLILALKVSGNNLTNVCKLVFKVSKDEKNDVHFTEGNILDLLMETATSADHVNSADALVYCVGALKFLSGTGTVIKVLAKRNCLHSMAQLLAAINRTITEAGKPQETLGHILVQLTATLRNLAEVTSKRSDFITDRVLEELCCVMVMYFNDGDLMLNVVRIYSKLSVHNDVSVAMAEEPKYFKSFVDLLTKYKRREDIIVRVCFILGNLTARTDEARRTLFETSKSFGVLLAIIKTSLSIDIQSKQQQHHYSSETHEDNGKSSKTMDVLIKTVRVIANLSINQDIGPNIATTDQCVVLLLQILDNPYLNGNDELILNTMATINNLSYYAIKESAITKRQKDVAESLSKFIRKDNIAFLSESLRVFGNLSRDRVTRQFMYKHKLDEVMIELLNANDKEVVFTACGVLINLMADADRRSMLSKHGGISKLIDVLKDFARMDWQLGSMVCQILWNYSGMITSSNAMFGEQEAQELSDTLVDLLDEDDVMLGSEDPEDLTEYTMQVWKQDFCPVARQLLERIETHQSDFESLDHPS